MPEISARKLKIYQEIFTACDTNQDGEICIAELKAFIGVSSSGRKKVLTDDQIAYIFSMGDKDNSKSLSFEEFIEVLENPDLKFLFGKWVTRYVNFLLPPRPTQIATEHVQTSVLYGSGTETQQLLFTPRAMRRSVSQETHVTIVTEDVPVSYSKMFTCCPPPFAMVIFSISALFCYLLDEISEKGSTLTGNGKTAKIFMYEPSKRIEVWRYLTYMLVHIGHVHIITNLVVQLMLGIPLEMAHKWARVTMVYFFGVIAGSLATSVTDPWTRLAGASGGVYALLTAHIASVIMNWGQMQFPIIQLFIFGIIITVDLGTAIYDRYFLNIENNVGVMAHFGGAVAGLLVGIYILKNLKQTTFEKYLWWVALVLFIILMVTAIFLNIFMPYRYPSSQQMNIN